MKLPTPLRRDPGLADALGRFVAMTPLLLPALGMMAGVALAWPVRDGVGNLTVAVAAIAAVAAILSFKVRRWLTLGLRAAAWTLAGIAAVAFHTPDPSAATLPESTARYRATVTDLTENNLAQTLTIAVTDLDGKPLPAEVKARLTVTGFEQEFERTSVIEFKARFAPVAATYDLGPDEESDPAEWLLRQDIRYTAMLPTASSVKVVGMGRAANIFRPIGTATASLIRRSALSPLSKQYLLALLTGDRSALDPSQRQLFSASGVAHLLALSGTHAGVIAMLASLALMPLALFGMGRVRPVIVVGLLWVYAFATGSQPSVVRAAAMLSLFIGARLLQRGGSSGNALCFALLVLLACDPSNLYNLGFQLSFASVAAILAFGRCFNPFTPRHPLLHAIFGMWSVAIAATLGTSLIATSSFHFFPVYFLAANTIAGLTVPLVIGGGVLVAAGAALGEAVPMPLIAAVDLAVDATDAVVQLFASLPGAVVDNLYFPTWIVLPYLGALALLRFFFSSPRRIYAVGAVSLGALALAGAGCARPAGPAAEWFVNRSAATPQLIINDGDTLRVFAPWSSADPESILNDAAARYRHYMGRRSLAGPVIEPGVERAIMPAPGAQAVEGRPKRGLIILPDGTSIFLVGKSTSEADLPERVDMLIVGANHKLPMAAIAGMTRCDEAAVGNPADSSMLRGIEVVDLSATPLRRRTLSHDDCWK